MNNYKVLSHTKWDCKYHVVFIPKWRKKVMYGKIRGHLGEILREMAERKESKVEEGHLMPDHVHMLLSIPPKFSISQVIGFIKGKSTIQIAQRFEGLRRNFSGHHFWARGYFVSTVGHNEELVRQYIRNQEQVDRQRDQLGLFL